MFVKGEAGDLTLKIEKIDGTNQFVEVPIHVAPEFSFTIIMILRILIFGTIIISKIRLVKINFN